MSFDRDKRINDEYRRAADEDLRRRIDELTSALDPDAPPSPVKTVTPAQAETEKMLVSLGADEQAATRLALAYEGESLPESARRSITAAFDYAASFAVRNRRPNVHGGHRKRLRATIRRDPDLVSLSDFELLEALLSFIVPRRDTNPTAHRLLSEYGSVLGVLRAPADELGKRCGISREAAGLMPVLGRICLWNGGREITIASRPDAITFFGSVYLGGYTPGTTIAYLDDRLRIAALEHLPENEHIDKRGIIGSLYKYDAHGIILSRRERGIFPPCFEPLEEIEELSRLAAEVGGRVLDSMLFSDCGLYSLGESAARRNGSREYVFVPLARGVCPPELAAFLTFDADDAFD